MLTVLQVLPSLEGGGVERGTLEVAAELTRRGHRSLVISSGGRLVETLEREGSRHFSWPLGRKSPTTLSYVRPLRRFMAEQGVDIVHVRSRMPAWVVWIAWRGMDRASRPRLVTTVHGLYSVSRYSAVMTRGERVVAVSETVARYIRDNYPHTPLEKIRLIPRGVDREAFPYGYRPAQDWQDAWYGRYPQLRGARVLTLAGRLTRLKGHRAFIRLVQELRSRGLGVQGLIVGGVDPRRRRYAAEMEDLVSRLGLEGYVVFTGHREDIKNIYACSDLIFSLSAKPESFGRTVVESLSMGAPVIGYDHGGVGEVLAKLFPEGRVPLNDPERLLEKTVEFLGSPPVVPKSTDYALQSMLDETLGLYEELVKESAVSG